MPRTEVRSNHVRWLHLDKPTDAELIALGEEFSFHPLDIADCRKQGQRQKVERYKDYVFLVLLFPVYNRQTRAIEAGEIDFFVGPDYVVTVDEGRLPPLSALRHQFADHADLRESIGGTSVSLLHELVDRLVVSLYPMLDHISLDIHRAEQAVFGGKEKQMVAEVAVVRRNITDFRRIVQTHKNTLKRVLDILHLNGLAGAKESIPSLQRTIDRTKEIWDLLESYRESIDTIHDTNESLMSFKLNDIMRTFTTMSVMIFFMTLVTTLFAVRARGTPLVEGPGAFWTLLGLIILSGIAARQFFKRRRLLE
ncbi:MAG: magnesium transporter CorA family protein [Candidatus Kerfeldbacteria bacterium]|nr:magnesium transporter CorA family protein [Candidatus Kerfeldbacteria bacterium]